MTSGAGKATRRASVDAARWRRTTCWWRSARTTPTPTWCCRSCCGSAGSTAATPLSRPSWSAGRSVAGHVRRGHRPSRRPDTRPCRPRRAALGAHQLLAMRVPDHAAVASTVELVRGRGRPQAGRLHQRGAAPGRRAGPRRRGWTSRCAPSLRVLPPGMGRRRARSGAGPARRAGGLLAADNERPRVTLVARPGLSTGRSWLGGPATARLAARVTSTPATPARSRPSRDGRAGVQDAGSQLVALAAARPSRAGTSAGSTCVPGPAEGGPARGGRGRAGARLLANERQPHRANWSRLRCGAVGDVVSGDGTRPMGRGHLRPRARRRTLPGWGAAPAAGEPLAAYPGGPRRSRTLAAGAAAQRPRLRCGPEAWSSTPPARPSSRRRAGSSRPVLADRPDLRLENIVSLVPEAEGRRNLPTSAGAVELRLHRHGTDARFMALLRRVEPASGGGSPT